MPSNNPKSQDVKSIQPVMTAAPLLRGNMVVRAASGLLCPCGARVRNFPKQHGYGFSLECDEHHDVVIFEKIT
jgi:hypothetical protein